MAFRKQKLGRTRKLDSSGIWEFAFSWRISKAWGGRKVPFLLCMTAYYGDRMTPSTLKMLVRRNIEDLMVRHPYTPTVILAGRFIIKWRCLSRKLLRMSVRSGSPLFSLMKSPKLKRKETFRKARKVSNRFNQNNIFSKTMLSSFTPKLRKRESGALSNTLLFCSRLVLEKL